ncbi:MAG TPA: 1-acyl-sn-glycerol-3-phosphate acyltransferase, partial [Chroococcidiopsis sp.]
MVTEAQPPLEFIAPDYSPFVTRVVRSLLPWWVRRSAKLSQIEATNTEQLVELYRQFQAGEIRLMLAFRHPSTNDPYCLAHLLWRELPKTAKAMGVPFPAIPHMHFIYDRGIPLWAGSAVGWLYTKLGGTPIRRGKVDIPGLRSIRQLFVDGQFPLAAAPEGATNGHNEIVSPIEPGIAQFGFWAIDDLKKAGRSERVVILPVGIQYHFVDRPWSVLEALLQELEIDSGLTPAVPQPALSPTLSDSTFTSEQKVKLYHRLYRLGEHLLTQMEDYYRKFYKQMLPAALSAAPVGAAPVSASPSTAP